MKKLVVVSIAVISLFVSLCIFLNYRSPALLAVTLPYPYGLVKVSKNTYSEKTLPEDIMENIDRIKIDGTQRVNQFYGKVYAEPVFLICVTERCGNRFGDGPSQKGKTYNTWVIYISPIGLSVETVSHELSHAYLHDLIGYAALGRGDLPAWFDEGLAVVVSREKKYLDIDELGHLHCRVEPDEDLPQGPKAWYREVAQKRGAYAKAACKVLRWLDANGGAQAVIDGAQTIRNGGASPFR